MVGVVVGVYHGCLVRYTNQTLGGLLNATFGLSVASLSLVVFRRIIPQFVVNMCGRLICPGKSCLSKNNQTVRLVAAEITDAFMFFCQYIT